MLSAAVVISTLNVKSFLSFQVPDANGLVVFTETLPDTMSSLPVILRPTTSGASPDLNVVSIVDIDNNTLESSVGPASDDSFAPDTQTSYTFSTPEFVEVINFEAVNVAEIISSPPAEEVIDTFLALLCFQHPMKRYFLFGFLFSMEKLSYG